MKRLRVASVLGSTVLLCAVAFGLFWVAAMSAPWSLYHRYDVEFTELPPSKA